jgi:CheY-like chemotaxis protein
MFVRSVFAKVIAEREQLEVLMATDLPGILIVDDNEDNRYTLQLMLESDGHERMTCATGGNEAIALIKKENSVSSFSI